MKDDFHYYQQAYNEVGTVAGDVAGQLAMQPEVLLMSGQGSQRS